MNDYCPCGREIPKGDGLCRNCREVMDGDYPDDPDDDPADWLDCDCEACSGTGWVGAGQSDGSGEIAMECPECNGDRPMSDKPAPPTPEIPTDTLLDDLEDLSWRLDAPIGIVPESASLTCREAAEEIRRLRRALAALDEGDPGRELRDLATRIDVAGGPGMLRAIADAIDKATEEARP